MGVYEAIQDVEKNHIVTHENDREWRNAVVMNKPSLLALRLVGRSEGSRMWASSLCCELIAPGFIHQFLCDVKMCFYTEVQSLGVRLLL